MDAAYDADEIRNYSESLGHIPIIDINPRRDSDLLISAKNMCIFSINMLYRFYEKERCTQN